MQTLALTQSVLHFERKLFKTLKLAAVHLLRYVQSFEKHSSHCINIRPVGTELFCVDGRTDMTKLIVALRNFANTPNNISSFIILVVFGCDDVWIVDGWSRFGEICVYVHQGREECAS
jgi:hypothetical protein